MNGEEHKDTSNHSYGILNYHKIKPAKAKPPMKNSWNKWNEHKKFKLSLFRQRETQLVFKLATSSHCTEWVHDPKMAEELDKAFSSLFFH